MDNGTRMASMRTTAAFQRTRMASDRTLMASLRTSLSMIGFGFTIFSFFRTLAKDDLLGNQVPNHAPALFGLALVMLGVTTLSIALVADFRYNASLRRQRQTFLEAGLLRADDDFPRSWAWVIAFLLLLVGLMAMLSILFGFGS
ncbi:DUF202 domain-containing protein [Sandaracinobacter neustonicus]|uniref:DUF202 domain-containing protein n=2 Tax=Sandaracinobacter neustonicus TaxID=1715348 RepID=A0A501XET4_9SPHN|nr:DUF202 domain-containing protein [Sandaracinobacter neustonicus]